MSQLVYLDALVPTDGETASGMLRITPPNNTLDPKTNWLLPPRPRVCNTPQETAWANERRSMQPMKTLTDQVHLKRPLSDWDFGLTYIKATEDAQEQPDSASGKPLTQHRLLPHGSTMKYNAIT